MVFISSSGTGLEEELSWKEESVGKNPQKAIVVSQVKGVSLNQGITVRNEKATEVEGHLGSKLAEFDD